MSRYRYTRYVPNFLDEVDLEDLLGLLKEYFLESGFFNRFYGSHSPSHTFDTLYRALAEILADDERLPEPWRKELKEFSLEFPEKQLSPEVRELLDRIVERMVKQGYLRRAESEGFEEVRGSGHGKEDRAETRAHFELTDKSIDFLGYRTLRELLGSLGRSSFGRHQTRELATGVETDAHSRPYEFGDTLNLDVNNTLLNALKRERAHFPPVLRYEDLMVYQSEYQSSCATVLMLDCSHSMILYGEDRFAPAKEVTLALAHLIRTQFPGDSLHVVLFHDSAEEIPLSRLPAVQVGPYHTNTCEGLRLARRILLNQKKDMRQIIMITDGKPSAVSLDENRIYKNPFGLDPLILRQTFREVADCRRSGILINTFMLARDYHLVEFVKKVSEICRGKAYFTTTLNLADYILMDFMTKKTRRVH